MPGRLLTATLLLLVGGTLGSVAAAPAQEPASMPFSQPAPRARPINLETEISAPMFHGTVRTIDRTTRRVTIRTDFGQLVPVAVENCEIIHRLHIGDRVRLDVDMQGIVRALEKPGAHLATAPNIHAPSAWPQGRCPEPTT